MILSPSAVIAQQAGAMLKPLPYIPPSAIIAAMNQAQQNRVTGGVVWMTPAGRTPADLPSDIVVGEIEAWRVWRVSQGRLYSMVLSALWQPGGSMTGDVKQYGVHAWPSMQGAFDYATTFSRLQPALDTPIVIGRVHLWGEVIEHERGYRAEHAAVTTLDAVIGLRYGTLAGATALLDSLRATYGLDKPTPAAPSSSSHDATKPS